VFECETFSQMGHSARNETQCLSNALPFWELHSCKSFECLEPWLKRQTNTKLGPQNTIGKFLKFRCLKFPLIVHLDMKCMSYDQNKGRESNWKFDFRPQIPLEQGSKDCRLEHVIHHWKDILRAIIFYCCMFQTCLIWKKYSHPKFWNNKSPKKKCHLDVALVKSHRRNPKTRGKWGQPHHILTL